MIFSFASFQFFIVIIIIFLFLFFQNDPKTRKQTTNAVLRPVSEPKHVQLTGSTFIQSIHLLRTLNPFPALIAGNCSSFFLSFYFLHFCASFRVLVLFLICIFHCLPFFQFSPFFTIYLLTFVVASFLFSQAFLDKFPFQLSVPISSGTDRTLPSTCFLQARLIFSVM